MRLNRATCYAVNALSYLAAEGEGQWVAAHMIAKARGVPDPLLAKVLKPLVAARVLQAFQGPAGGYRLARPARQVTLLEVMEAVEGPVRGQAQFPRGEGGALGRQLETAFDQAAAVIREQFAKVKLSDLAGKKGK
jgi:Rrf2 family protein